jgi:hypothetical protein
MTQAQAIAFEEATRKAQQRIAYGDITLEKYQAGMVDLILHLADSGLHKDSEWSLEMARDCGRCLTRVSLHFAEREELAQLADPDPSAVCERIVVNDGYDTGIDINRAQYVALLRKFMQNPDGSPTLGRFMTRIRQGHGCLMLHWCGMWLGIEPDGYTHS